MRIACLCPTYKRPELLQNAVACFLEQEHQEKHLFILDDAGQYKNHSGNHVTVVSTPNRVPFEKGLPEKYRQLISLANDWEADAYAIWEDDDVFFPWHLSNAQKAFDAGIGFFRTPFVFTNYNLPAGRVQLEGAAGRFHSSWVFTKQIYESVGGYNQTSALNFDQQLWGKLASIPITEEQKKVLSELRPGYVYCWGNGLYHGSQAGDGGYHSLWNILGNLPAPFIGDVVPKKSVASTQYLVAAQSIDWPTQ